MFYKDRGCYRKEKKGQVSLDMNAGETLMFAGTLTPQMPPQLGLFLLIRIVNFFMIIW